MVQASPLEHKTLAAHGGSHARCAKAVLEEGGGAAAEYLSPPPPGVKTLDLSVSHTHDDDADRVSVGFDDFDRLSEGPPIEERELSGCAADQEAALFEHSTAPLASR